MWKYIQNVLFSISALALLGVMFLLRSYAMSASAPEIADANHTVRYQYGSIVFYLASSEEFWLQTLWALFGIGLISGGVVAVLRGDIQRR